MKCSCQRIGIVVLNSAWMRGYGSHVCVCCGGGGGFILALGWLCNAK
jgi:hypothetical protein